MAEARNSKLSTIVLWLAACVALVLIFFGVRRITREKLSVRVATASIQDLVKTISTNGKVEPEHNFSAHAPTAGVVQALYVQSGDRIPANKLLLTLDDSEAQAKLASAESAMRGAEANLQAVQNGGSRQEQLKRNADIAKAKLELEQAAGTLAAVRKLAAQGAASTSELTQAEHQSAVAEASLKALESQQSGPFSSAELNHARAAVSEARAAYAAAGEVVTQSNVRSPFAGTVYSVSVAQYDYVQAGEELLALADLSKLRVRAYFDEPEIGDLQLGNPVTIVWDAKPGRTWHGHIVRLPSSVITYGTRNVGEVFVSIDDLDGTLLPNTNVTVTVTTAQVKGALTVPREALHIEDGRNYVYVVSGEFLHRVQVQVGALNLTEVQILSGLQDHATVALGATNGVPLSEGVPIQIER